MKKRKDLWFIELFILKLNSENILCMKVREKVKEPDNTCRPEFLV